MNAQKAKERKVKREYTMLLQGESDSKKILKGNSITELQIMDQDTKK